MGLGALIMRTLRSASQPKDLESKFSELQNEHNQYQQNVAQHFVDTSRLIIESQQRQQALRDHLINGALHLTSPDISRAILAEGDEAESSRPQPLEHIDPATLKPPKDWAPKTPGQQGVLSEDFGLKDEQEEDTQSIEVKTARAGLHNDDKI